jgi:hypothetical protein
MCRGAAIMTRSLLAIAIQQLEKMVQLLLAFEAHVIMKSPRRYARYAADNNTVIVFKGTAIRER